MNTESIIVLCLLNLVGGVIIGMVLNGALLIKIAGKLHAQAFDRCAESKPAQSYHAYQMAIKDILDRV